MGPSRLDQLSHSAHRRRRAEPHPAVVELADAGRRQHAGYQPSFWRPAPDATERHRPHLARLVDDEASITLVAVDGDRVVGFASASLLPAPPVYDPGGPACLLDDLTVADPDGWATIGADLLTAVREAARARGAAHFVVVAAHQDGAKRVTLAAAGLGIGSQWWVAPVSSTDSRRSRGSPELERRAWRDCRR